MSKVRQARFGRMVGALAALLAGFLALPAHAGPVEMIPIPAVTIYPGDMISAEMLTEGRYPAGTVANYPVIGSRDELVGKVARRTLLAGRLIGRNTVSDPALVQKGKIVPAVYQHGAVTITASVLALQSGALNEAIQVRNIDSGKVIIGTVSADGAIRIGDR